MKGGIILRSILRYTRICILSFYLPLVINGQEMETTCFQTASPWHPKIDIRSDVTIVYGVTPDFASRVQSWRDRGYGIHMMTGSAWGGYQDYFEGRFDGKTHPDEGQVQRDGETIWHGPSVPYIVPTEGYLTYLKSLIKTAIDEGVTTIHLEEPEFWNRAGYSEGFKREWQQYYGQPWQAQHESPAATYMSNKLKYHLYIRALSELFTYAKDYGRQSDRDIRCFVPTHSLLNYSSWNIVSPEAALAHIPGLDGFIGQVWTGTAREPNYYEGRVKERTFETAFLEYGSVEAMTRPTGKRVYFLTDPIEDNPDKTWEDYKLNYEATFTAQLMYPQVAHFEVMPWPRRIFFGAYQVEGSAERQTILPAYATEVLILIQTLNNMKQDHIHFPGTKGISVLQSNSMMFQSFPHHDGYEDPWLSNFYGMALPLLKHGIPVNIVQMEHLTYPAALDDTKLLIMSYANMKPLEEAYHMVIADWVKKGGTLIYSCRDNGPFQHVPEWWNQGEMKYEAPAHHLFEKMGLINPVRNAIVKVGQGHVYLGNKDPKEYLMTEGGGNALRTIVRQIFALSDQANQWQEKNVLHLERGPYDIIAVLDESISRDPYQVEGSLVDLFNPDLPVLDSKRIGPGERSFLYNLDRDHTETSVIAAASRVYEEQVSGNRYTFTMTGPAKTDGIARVRLPRKPKQVSISDQDKILISDRFNWDERTKTALIRYPNNPQGVSVAFDY